MPLSELKDVRPPVDLPANHFWLFVVLGLLTAAGLFFLARWLKQRMDRHKARSVIVRPPWDIANEELNSLEKENLPSQGKVEEYFVRLSAITRHYLEGRFSVSAPDMTTDEFLLHIKTIDVLNPQQKNSLKEFLVLSDMVKFARYSSTEKEMHDALSAAKRLITETIPNIELVPHQP